MHEQVFQDHGGFHMKKIVVLLMVLLMCSLYPAHSEEPIKVLIDESRADESEKLDQWMIDLMEEFGFEYEEPSDPRYSVYNTEESFGFAAIAKRLRNEFSVNVKKSGKISYSTLRNIDVLVILSFKGTYTDSEVTAIKQFVENGGGLFFAAHYSSSNNAISREFGVLFPPDEVYICDEDKKNPVEWHIYVNDFVSHPVTEGITQILLDNGMPIVSYDAGDVLARTGDTSWAEGFLTFYEKDEKEDSGPFDILLAQSVDLGRTIFFGSRGTFYNSTVEEPDQTNADLLVNAIKWLGEPGGPYKQYVAANEQGQQLMDDAQSLFANHEFSQAKQKFEDALHIFTTSHKIYDNEKAQQGIANAETAIAYCETGLQADKLVDTGKEFFQDQNLKEAVTQFKNAQTLYRDIGFDTGVEECKSRIEECTALMAIREEATTLFGEGQTALEKASSILSTAGYEKAQSLFEQAKSKWEQFGDESKIKECEEQIAVCQREITDIKKVRMMLIGAVTGVIIAVGAFLVVKKRNN